ncbi:LysR family transcriptional regulator, partial [Rhizobium brockwellii]
LDEGSGLEFQQILPGRNVVACRVTHPLLMKRRPQPVHLLDFPWVATPPGSPLLADLRSMLHSFGATEVKLRYSGGSLRSV